MNAFLDRVPPQSLEMEMAVLGSCLIERIAIDEAAAILRPEDFYREANRVIWEAILNLIDHDEPVDLLTLQGELRRQEILENVGGAPYLFQLTDAVPTATNVRFYARAVEEQGIRRRLLHAAHQIEAAVHSELEPGEDISQIAESLIYETVRSRSSGADMTAMRPVVSKWFEWCESRADSDRPLFGIQSGISELDRITNGLKPGNMVVVGARPGMGKTGMLMNVAAHVAAKHGPVAVFSLEMNTDELMSRIVSGMARVDSRVIESGRMNDEQWRRVGAACADIAELPIFACDDTAISAAAIRSKLRRLQSQKPIALVIVDYLQLISPARRSENRTQEVGEISRSIKAIAREFNVPVLAAAQINRQSESRAGKRPQLSDLRESGSIEAEADLVIFIHRPEFYSKKEKGEECRGMEVAELIVDKHRNGATGVLRVAFTPEFTRFDDLDERTEVPGWAR